jgi:hypothetical protein
MTGVAQPRTRRHGNETSQALACRTPDQAMKRLEEKIDCAADVQQVAVN